MEVQLQVNKNLTLSPILEEMIFSVNPEQNCFGEFTLFVEFSESMSIPTAGVYITSHGMKCVYNPEFMGKLSKKQQIFVVCHEIYHLWRCHFERGDNSDAELRKAQNIAADMLINDNLIEYSWSEMPEKGHLTPSEYDGDRITEPLAEWLMKERPDLAQCDTLDVHIALGDGETTGNDEHQISGQFAKAIVDDVLENMRGRGLIPSSLDHKISQLRKQPVDYLRLIKSSLGMVKGRRIKRTWRRLHRRQIPGIRGRRSEGSPVNVILDTSGSMIGFFEKILSTIYRGGYTIKVYQIDTELKNDGKPFIINKPGDLAKMEIKGLGGTTLQPAIDHLEGERVLILSDGGTDALDCSRLKQCLILTCHKCPIRAGNPKQIIIPDDRY